MLAILVKRRRHSNHEHVRRLDLRSGAQQPALDDALNEPVEIDLLNVDFAAIDSVDDRLADVDAVNVHPRPSDDGGRGQADVPEPDNANTCKGLAPHTKSPQNCRRTLLTEGRVK